MPQALPILPQLPGLDGRTPDARPRPADPTHRSEHREMFDRLLERFSRPDTTNDVRPEAPRDPVAEPPADEADEPVTQDAADADREPAEKDGATAKEKTEESKASAPQVVPVIPVAIAAVQVQAAPVAESEGPVIQAEATKSPKVQLKPTAQAVESTEKVAETAATVPVSVAAPAPVDAQAPVMIAGDNRPVQALPAKTQATAAVDVAPGDKKPTLANLAANLAGPTTPEQPAERKFDLNALQLRNEPKLDSNQPGADAKAKSGSSNAAAQVGTPLTMREEPVAASERSDQPIAAFAADSPRSAAALYHKIAEAARPADAPPPAEQISMRLLHAVADGKRAIQVHLHPAELGSIDVKMQWQGDRLTAQFTVDRPETLQLLQRDIPALERGLSQAGVNVDSGSLQFSLRQQQDQGRSGGQGFAPARDQAVERMDLGGGEPLGQVVREGLLSIRV